MRRSGMQRLGDLGRNELSEFELHAREGRFQRWLSLIAGVSAAMSGLEVSYEHYTGSYSRRIMYTPLICSGALAIAGSLGFFSRRAARTALPVISVITLADCVTGFIFHVRGIARKPGGWRFPMQNMAMGPPIFAPLLFGVSGYLGLVASFLRRGDGSDGSDGAIVPKTTAKEPISWEQDIREGRFQKHMAAATVVAVFFSGFEAWYSHYKNNFRYSIQWSPLLLTPLVMAAGIGAIRSPRVAHTWLPAVSALAIADGTIGFGFHVRGVLRRPGGRKKLIYNIVYGPPIFAPLLFAACGFLGVLASLLRRDDTP